MRIRDSIHSDKLPKSYYADSLKYSDPFPRIEGNVKAEVCVIGGGYTGVASALALAERGVDVALVEQNQIGWGASGRNGGQIIGGFGPELSDFDAYEKTYGKHAAETMWQAGIECVDIVKQTIERHNIDCGLTWGYFDAAMNDREMQELASAEHALKALNYPHSQRLVSKADIKSVVGSDRYVGGLINDGWGHCHPLNLVRGQAGAAAGLGAKIFEDARVSNIEYDAEKVTVDMDWGRVSADKVIIATNAYIGPLVPKLEALMLPAGSYIIGTEPLTDEQVRDVLPGNHAVCDQRWALDYFRLSEDNRLLFGGVATYSGLHPRNVVAKMRPKMLKVFPQLENVRIDHEWGGYLAVSRNRIPQIGRLDERTYYAQAYSGHGLAASHMAARLIVEALEGNDERLRMIEAVEHKPFPGGPFFRVPLLATGMAIERAKELFRR